MMLEQKIDDITEVDFVLANGYLAYVFAETLLSSGMEASRGHWQMCRRKLHVAVSRLPLLLPASAELIAALTVAAFDAMENANATAAATFLSSAARACIALGYHRADKPGGREQDGAARREREGLFWSIYTLGKGLSMQLDQPPNIRDADITRVFDGEGQPHTVRLARIQGQDYEQLYSSVGLDRPVGERARDAEMLATRLRELIQEIHGEKQNVEAQPAGADGDPLRLLYLQCGLVWHANIVNAARAILNIPFVPSSVLSTHAVRSLDAEDDLARLERFASSLQPETGDAPGEAATHPHRLYQLLCDTARLHTESARQRSGPSRDTDREAERPAGSGARDETQALHAVLAGGGFPPDLAFNSDGLGFGDWYYRNQQLMNLLGSDGGC